ncbi:MAG: hypothetical protein PHH82_00900 [Candidatus ainarchaeum sp.]|nr:hypothetical protein [Candidatus ainarchaeum sp.]
MTNLITTSRKPGRNLRKFVRQVCPIFNTKYFVRGKTSVKELAEYLEYEGYDKLIVVSEFKGNPGSLIIYTSKNGFFKQERKYKITYYKLSEKKMQFPKYEIELEDKENKDFFKYLGTENEKVDAKIIDDKGIIKIKKGKDTYLSFKVEKVVEKCLK